MLHPAQRAANTSPRLQGQHGRGCRGDCGVHDGGWLTLTLLVGLLVIFLFLLVLLQPLPWRASGAHSKLDSTAGIEADWGLVTAACRLTARAWLRRLLDTEQGGGKDCEKGGEEVEQMIIIVIIRF